MAWRREAAITATQRIWLLILPHDDWAIGHHEPRFGIDSQPKELVIIEVAVILLTAQALAINRLAGIPYPLWKNHMPWRQQTCWSAKQNRRSGHFCD
jgi:hypothetical protein